MGPRQAPEDRDESRDLQAERQDMDETEQREAEKPDEQPDA